MTHALRSDQFDVKMGDRISSAWMWMNLLRHARMQNKDDNKQIKDDKK